MDVGSAEGIYALDRVELAARTVLFEVDPEWVGALERTFAPWRDRVVIINKFASDVDEAGSGDGDDIGGDGGGIGGCSGGSDTTCNTNGSGGSAHSGGIGSVTVDSVARELGLGGPLMLKMDVEGAEERVLAGAGEVLSRPDTRAVICTYHRDGDHARLSERMRTRGFDVATSPGWMLFVHDRAGLQPPFFRRGVIYCAR